jgi:hypothetical protein
MNCRLAIVAYYVHLSPLPNIDFRTDTFLWNLFVNFVAQEGAPLCVYIISKLQQYEYDGLKVF